MRNQKGPLWTWSLTERAGKGLQLKFRIISSTSRRVKSCLWSVGRGGVGRPEAGGEAYAGIWCLVRLCPRCPPRQCRKGRGSVPLGSFLCHIRSMNHIADDFKACSKTQTCLKYTWASGCLVPHFIIFIYAKFIDKSRRTLTICSISFCTSIFPSSVSAGSLNGTAFFWIKS